jgi:hypothetical protein
VSELDELAWDSEGKSLDWTLISEKAFSHAGDPGALRACEGGTYKSVKVK